MVKEEKICMCGKPINPKSYAVLGHKYWHVICVEIYMKGMKKGYTDGFDEKQRIKEVELWSL